MSTFLNADWKWALGFLADSAIKGGVVILAAAAIAWMLRRGSAAARHSVWSAAVAAQLLIPIMGLLLPTWRVGVIDPPAALAPFEQVAPTSSVGSPESSPSNTVAPPPSPTAPAPISAARSLPAVAIVGGLWMLGTLIVLGRLLVGTAVVSRMAARGERVVDEKWLGTMHRLAVALGISRPLTLLRGDSVGVPVTWGIVYPVVFLPQDADEWPEERRRYVLVHEMAHVKRLDAFTQLVAQLTAAIFWFNPLVWLAVSRMRRERENACDDYVLTHGTKPSEYASDLLQLVRSMGTRGHKGAAPAFAALAMARRSEFEGRMLSILDPEAERTSLSRTRVALSGVAAMLVIVPLSAFSPFNAEAHTLRLTSTTPPVTQTPSTPAPEPARQKADAVAPAKGAASASPVTIVSSEVTTTFSGLGGSPCDELGSGTSSSSHISEDDGVPTARRIQLLRRTPGYCFEAALHGQIIFADDDRDVTRMSSGSRLRMRERTRSSDREILLSPDNGAIRREYYENGKPSTFDADAEAWFGAKVLTAIRETGIDARRRVTRISQSGGAAAVLSEIETIQSTGARRNYYLAYLQSTAAMTGEELARVLRQARIDLASSSGDLSSVLQAAAPRGIRNAMARSAFADAAASIESDGDKTNVLTQAAMTADPDLLVDIMRAARTIGSDGDKSRLLITTAARYLVPRESELRDAYFTVVEQVGSDGDRARVLISASAYGSNDENVTLSCLRATHAMGSDGDKASVLISMLSRRLLVNQRIKDAFLAATNRIGSDSDRARVLSALVAAGGN